MNSAANLDHVFVRVGLLSVLAGGIAAPIDARGGLPATIRVNVGPGNLQANGFSSEIPRNRPSLSGDGRFTAFESMATNLVAGDTNGTSDIFVHDRQSGVTTRVSVSSSGAQATSECSAPEITPDGRWVMFTSTASNLVAGDPNNSEDVFVHDNQTGATICASVTPAGVPGLGQSGLGAFDSFYRRPITPDGRYVTFMSNVPNLVPGDTNVAPDVFRRDLQTGTTVRVSVDALGAQVSGTSSGPSITPDGRYVAFESTATALVAGDTNGAADVFVKDMQTGSVVLVSTSSTGVHGNFISFDASISSDGLIVAFQSASTNLVAGDTNGRNDLFVKRLDTGAIVRANLRPDGTQSTALCDGPMLSRDGRFLAFWSDDPMLVAGDMNGVQDVFERDLCLGQTRRVSVGASGAEADSRSWFPDLSSNGVAVVFASYATNLVPGDTNNKSDVFVRDLQLAGAVVFCTAKINSAGCTPAIQSSGLPSVGPGTFVIGATQVLNNKSGLLFYGYSATAAPFYGGTRCAQTPLRRTAPQNSAGNPPPNDCSGTYSFDMHAWILSGADPALIVGTPVVAQFWSRDPASVQGAGLTDAVAFTMCP
jgi:Tol biopolymer transport system component